MSRQIHARSVCCLQATIRPRLLIQSGRCSIFSVRAWLESDGDVRTERRERVTYVSLLIFVYVFSLLACFPHAMAQNSSPNRDINTVLAAHDKELLAIPDVVGVYVGTTGDDRQLCLKVMLARANPESERKIPRMIEGYPVVTEVTGEIKARGRSDPQQKR
jgi:hypothetical protein